MWLRRSGLGIDRVGVTHSGGNYNKPPAMRPMWLFPYRKPERVFDEVPLVSCLMVTQTGRHRLAAQAIECYRRQTWRRRELVVIDGSEDDALTSHLARLGDPSIRHIRVRVGALTLGDLRNLSVREASGSYVCTWDDDDLSDPSRIEAQMSAVARTGAAACFLTRMMIWWPDLERLAEKIRVWEASMLCRKDILGTYPSVDRFEDSPLVEEILRSHRVAYLDRSALYVYVYHGANTWNEAHFNHFWRYCAARFAGEPATALLAELGSRVPIAGYRAALHAARAEFAKQEAPAA